MGTILIALALYLNIIISMSVCIFDLDGTLVDSQELWRKTSNQTFASYGVDFQADSKEWLTKVIHGGKSIVSFITDNDLPIDIEEFKTKRNALFLELAKTELKLMPGAKRLIVLLHENNYQLAIASHSKLNQIERVLKIHNLNGYFQLYVSDQDVPNQKPAPDVYLEAAKQLGVTPADCLVFEDSQAGLAAAKAAGMKCIVCPDRYSALPKAHYRDGDLVIESLKKINIKTIQKILNDISSANS